MSKETSSMAQMDLKAETKISSHLVMLTIVSVFSIILIIVTCVLSWEMWMIPLIVTGVIAIWSFHIDHNVSSSFFENICAGMMLVEFFYYAVHEASIFGMPVVICVLLFILSMLDKKYFLHIAAVIYIVALLYQCFILKVVSISSEPKDFISLGIGVVGTFSTMFLARHMVNRRKLETMRIREMTEQLENARQQNADFLSNISHELRTPINMVTGISEVALEKKVSHEIRENLQSIQLAGKRLSGQINDILDYTEIVGKTLVSVDDQYMVPSVIGDVIAMLAVQYKGINLETVFDIDVNLPLVISGDGEKISRIIKILMDNAIKFTEEGGIYVHVGYRKESYGINLDVDICDTGIGIQSSQISHICEDFYQADASRSRNAGGLGLGLSIVQGLLHAMGGFIQFESDENNGTKVHFSVPQSVVDDRPCMTVNNPENFCVACYFKTDKYVRKEVREFYDNMIWNMAVGLGVEGHRVYNLDELDNLMQKHKLTHFFIAQEEYLDDSSYFEDLADKVNVVLLCDEEFDISEDSKMLVLHKPLSPLPFVNLLNGVHHESDIGGMPLGQSFTCEGVRALVVDDEEMNLVVARGILSGYGMEVDTCLGGEDAINRCMGSRYDIVFLDHMMPGIDGVETLKRIRRINDGAYKYLPIIALTANAISGAREMFKNEGFSEFVPKPIERPVLERALRRVLPEDCIRYETVEQEKDRLSDIKAGQRDKDESDIGATEDNVDFSKDSDEDLKQEIENTPIEFLCQGDIDVELGLQYCSGMEEFYIEMLAMFYEQSDKKKNELISLYNNENWEEYAIKTHALKSASLTIGAKKLSEQAKALEFAGKDKDVGFIQDNHKVMLDMYTDVCALIGEFLGSKKSVEGGDGK